MARFRPSATSCRRSSGTDRLSARRFLGQARDIDVAIGCHHQGARDRRRGHHQEIDASALVGESHALLDAETVLLVHDGEAQVAEFHVFLNQGMGADN